MPRPRGGPHGINVGWCVDDFTAANGATLCIPGWYTLPIYLPQENWFLSANPAIRQFGSETLQTLLGFRPQAMRRINGLDRI